MNISTQTNIQKKQNNKTCRNIIIFVTTQQQYRPCLPQIDRVVKYILNQPEHHKKQVFREEYLSFLNKFTIDYDPKYLFEWYDENR